MSRKLTSKDKLIHASDFKCVECGEQAEVFFPVMDPDIPSYPYCKKCANKAHQELIIKILEIDRKYNNGEN